METHIAPFKGPVVFIGLFVGFHVSFREGRGPACRLI